MIQLEHSDETLFWIHDEERCKGQPCTVHNRTDHHMRGWPQHWRRDRRMMERICPHGVGHPDPDELPEIDTVHGCDGCCVRTGERMTDERFKQISDWAEIFRHGDPARSVFNELLQAIEAECAEVKKLRNDSRNHWKLEAEKYKAEVERLRATESGDLFHERKLRLAAKARVERLEEAAAYACAEFDENWKEGRVSIDAKTAHDALAKLIADTQEKGE